MATPQRRPQPSRGARTAAAIRSTLDWIVLQRDREQTIALLHDVRHYLNQLRDAGDWKLDDGTDMVNTYTQDHNWVHIPLPRADVRIFRASGEGTSNLREFVVRERVIEELSARQKSHLVIMCDLIGQEAEDIQNLLVALGLMRTFPHQVTLLGGPEYLHMLPAIRRYFQFPEPEDEKEEEAISAGFINVLKKLPLVASTKEGFIRPK